MQTANYYLHYFHNWFWGAMHFAHAYLAYHQGKHHDCAEHEAAMLECERKQDVLTLNRRLTK